MGEIKVGDRVQVVDVLTNSLCNYGFVESMIPFQKKKGTVAFIGHDKSIQVDFDDKKLYGRWFWCQNTLNHLKTKVIDVSTKEVSEFVETEKPVAKPKRVRTDRYRRYRAGSRVKVKNNIKEGKNYHCHPPFTQTYFEVCDEMAAFAGKLATVLVVDNDGAYQLKFDGEEQFLEFFWTDGMITRAK